MFKQLREEARANVSARLNRATGGGVEKTVRSAISQHDDQLHGGKTTKLKFADGGAVDMPSGERRDRRARGGPTKSKKHPTVNVIVAPSLNSHPPETPKPPMMGPPPMLPPGPGAPPMPPGGGMGGAPGGMAGGPPIGAMAPKMPPMMMGPRARGGKVSYPISDGAGGGEGRLQKKDAYGSNADKGEGRKRGGRA